MAENFFTNAIGNLAGLAERAASALGSLESVLDNLDGDDDKLAGIREKINADRKSTRLNSSHIATSRMPSSA